MRKFVTAAAAALVLTLGLAGPALADHNQNNNYPYQGGYNQNQNPNAHQDDDYRYPQDGQFDRRHYDRFDFGRHNGNFDRWERGWGGQHGYNHQYRYQKPMKIRKLMRALAYQGFYGVRNLQPSRWGWEYRAFAFTRNGRPVMLRVNPYSGRVTDVRYI